MIKARINHIFTKCLVDSGASISAIRRDIYHSTGAAKLFPAQATDLTHVQGVSGTLMKVTQKVDLTINIGNLDLTHTFYILDDMKYSIILGIDFLQQQQAILSWETNTLQLMQGITSTPLINRSDLRRPSAIVAKTEEALVIDPQSEILFSASTSQQVSQAKTYLLQPSAKVSMSRNGAIGVTCVAKPNASSSFPYKILNTTNHSVSLPKGTPVATVTLLAEENISRPINQPDTNNTDMNAIDALDDETKTNYRKLADELNFDLSQTDLTSEQKDDLLIFLGKNRKVFAKDLSELGRTSIYHHKIHTGDNPPVKRRFYRTTPATKRELDKKLDEMLKHDIIEPTLSPYASPCILVKKPNGDWRVAIDYRELNKTIQPINYAVARLDDIFDSLAESKSKIFSSLDLASSFWQIPLHADSKHKTAFTTYRGNYQFNVTPMGLSHSTHTYNLVMNKILHKLNWLCALTYIDDILVYSQNYTQHLQHLQLIFDRLREHNLTLKPSKCKFALKEVCFLGHVITKDGVKVNPDKMSAVMEFPTPTTQKHVRQILGLGNFYRKFIYKYSELVHPLNNLLRKDVPFQWTEECDKAFKTLKEKLVSAPILVYPDFTKPFILYTDASNFAISYILGQVDDQNREKVIAYGGRAVHKHEASWHINTLEALAIVEGIKHYHVYLANSHFTVITDNISSSYFTKVKEPKGRLARWVIFTQSYDFDIVHRPGRKHGNADALSRREYAHSNEKSEISIQPEMLTIESESDHKIASRPWQEYQIGYESNCPSHNNNTHTNPKHSPLQLYAADLPIEQIAATTPASLQDLQREDPEYQQLINYLTNDELPSTVKDARRLLILVQDYILENGVLFHLWYPKGKGHKKERVIKQLCVPHTLRNDILLSYHDSVLACHMATERCFQTIRMKYYWKSMYQDIKTYIETCEECQKSKRHYQGKSAPLHPFKSDDDIFSRLHMDFLELNKTPEGFKYLLVVTCAFSKWNEAFPMKSTKAVDVARVLYDEIITRYGAFKVLITDRAQDFVSKLIKELCNLFQITKLNTCSYCPQGNAQVERTNGTILKCLRIYSNKEQNNWPSLIPSILLANRIAPNESTGLSPYMILFGRECRLPLDTALLPPTNLHGTAEDYMRSIIEKQQMTREIVQENISKAQEKYKTHYDKKTKEPSYKVGQRVWLYSSRVQKGLKVKMIQKYVGPYYIVQIKNNITFKLRRCADNTLVRSMIHANRLKPYHDPASRPTNLPEMFRNDTIERNPEEITEENEDDPPHLPQTQNMASQEDVHETGSTQTVAGTPDQTDQWFPVDKLLKCAKIRGKKQYKVKWRGKNHPPTWEPEENIPDILIREYHINKTMTGRKRKRPKQSW